MILSFKLQFAYPILRGTKIHTIREDLHNCWGAGRKIQAATGVRTKQYNEFFEAECISIQKIFIDPVVKSVSVFNPGETRVLCPESIERLSKNDGFKTVADFWNWFNKPFIGKIIHWTNYRY